MQTKYTKTQIHYIKHVAITVATTTTGNNRISEKLDKEHLDGNIKRILSDDMKILASNLQILLATSILTAASSVRSLLTSNKCCQIGILNIIEITSKPSVSLSCLGMICTYCITILLF